MYVLQVRNVNEALKESLHASTVHGMTRTVSPRGNRTIEFTEPVTTVYACPQERVLFSPVRDANPFLHFFEALWIMQGRKDVEFLADIVSAMKNYSDNGFVFHGSYGDRLAWRSQLHNAVAELKRDPHSRRAAAAIWQPHHDSGYTGLDMPCNMALTFKIREGQLHLTVFNRSNDAIWGAYGTNAVQFSTILEWVAVMVGVPMGVYRQVSDSLHFYDNEQYRKCMAGRHTMTDPYAEGDVRPLPITIRGATMPDLYHDLVTFFEKYDRICPEQIAYRTVYFQEVVKPAWDAFTLYKDGELDRALCVAMGILATDWRKAMLEWLQRRAK